MFFVLGFSFFFKSPGTCLWVDAWLSSGDILGEDRWLGGELLAGEFCSNLHFLDGISLNWAM